VNGRTMRYKKGPDVDTADVLPDGRRFKDIDEFKQLLLKDKDQLARALAERLLAYATGGAPTKADRPEVDAVVRAVRVLGTMIGLELTFDASDIVTECLRRHLLINATHGHVIRLLPALTITDDQIDEGCAILADVLRNAVA